MKTRGSSSDSIRVQGGAVLHKYLFLILTSVALFALCEPAMAVGPGHGGLPRYTALGTTITVRDAPGLIDLMDPVNWPLVCGVGTIINLVADIDMTPFPLTLGAQDPTFALPNLILGTEIGFDTHPFVGLFNGNGFVIKNLTIIGGGNHVIPPLFPPNIVVPQTVKTNGLFGVVHAPVGTNAIQNLILLSPSITGYADDVGGLVGRLDQGIVFQCCVLGPGQITASGANVNVGAGALVGHIQDPTGGFLPAVDQCFATCNVTGPTDVGGLVGRINGPGPRVTNSYATGHRVTGLGTNFDSARNLGGLVGLNNQGVISCCYSSCASPIAPDPSPGLTPATVGALVGTWIWTNAPMITNYCAAEDSLLAIGAFSLAGAPWVAVATPRATLSVPATYNLFAPGWPFGTVWALPLPGGTPRLLWQSF